MRDRWEVIEEILGIVEMNKKANQISILQNVGLNNKNFHIYIKELLEKGFLTIDLDDYYEITEEGRILYNKMKDLYEYIEKCTKQ